MMMKIAKYFFLVIIFFISACQISYNNIEFDRAQKAVNAGQYKQAIEHFNRVVKRAPETPMALKASRQAAKLSMYETEMFDTAIYFFRHLIMYSKDPSERLDAQEKVAFIYFDKLSNYEFAIKEYSHLILNTHNKSKVIEYRIIIAKSYFYLNNFYQAMADINEILKMKLSSNKTFEVELFKANILVTTKKIEEAIIVYKSLMERFPDLSRKEKVGMSIALAYEDMNEFEKAIKTLEGIKTIYSSPEFVEVKIRRLKQRMKNLPGAR